MAYQLYTALIEQIVNQSIDIRFLLAYFVAISAVRLFVRLCLLVLISHNVTRILLQFKHGVNARLLTFTDKFTQS